MIATETYLPPPGRDVEETTYEKYSEWLADLIRDVRKDLNAPKMPVVIGVMGIGGPSEKHPRIRAFREAMAAPTAWPEFKGNVVAVPTAPFWDDKLGAIDKKHNEVGELRWKLGEKVKAGQMTQEAADQELKDFETKLISPEEVALWNRGASNGDYHYLGCTKTMAQIGRAFAEALIPPAGGNSAACPKPAFLDLDDEFLQPGGSINPETMWDYLHPNESGYRIWADAIQPYIARYVPRKTRIEQH